MPHRTRAVAIPLALALAACAHFDPKPVSVPAVAQQIEERSLSAPELLASIHDRLGRDAPPWDFEALATAALFYSPALDLARAQLATAEAARITAAQRPLATLTLPFQYTTNPKPDESPYTYGLALDIPIETAGKRGHRIAQADQLSLAARHDIGSAAWRVRSQLRDQWVNLWDARARSALLERQVQQREALVRFLEHRVEAGQSARPELFQARADLARERSQRAAAQRQAAQALAAAAAVIGVPLPALQAVPLDFASFSTVPAMPSRSLVIDEALRNRADIQSVLARYEASQAALQLAIAGQYPDIHLGPGFTYDAGAHKIAFDISGIPLPVFGVPKGAIAQARARREEAAAQVEQAVATAIGQVDQAFAAIAPARTNLRATDNQVQAQAALVRAASEALRQGEDDRVNLLRAEITAGSAALDRHDAFMQLQRAAGALEDAVQRPLDIDVAQPRSARSP